MNRSIRAYMLSFACTLLFLSNCSAMHTTIDSDKPAFDYISCVFTDLNGELRSIIRPAHYLQETIHNGIDFDGSSIPGYAQITESDMHLIPDPNSIYPTTNQDAYIICDVYKDETLPHNADSRIVLKQAIAAAEQLGYRMKVGAEMEFFILNPDGSPCDTQSYCCASGSPDMQHMTLQLLQYLQANGIKVEKMHHEVAPGQYEIVLHHTDPLTMADHITLCRHFIKQFVQGYGLHASFAPKPFRHHNGSALHMHFSLTDLTGATCFYDNTQPAHLSVTAQSFIAGILKHIKSFTLLLNPIANSYDRLQPGYEAPVALCWAAHNRSALIRIPRIAHGNAAAARAEIRSPDSSCNPYLAFAALLRTGLHGISKNLSIPTPVTENVYQLLDNGIDLLPNALYDAYIALATDKHAKVLFGDTFINTYLSVKEKALKREQQAT